LDRKQGDYYFNIFLNLIRATYMNLEKEWEKVANKSGLTHAQQHALWILHLDNGLTLEELGNIAMWNKSTTSMLISRLEKKGFVQKEKYMENSRTIKIYITEEGIKTVRESVNTDIAFRFMGMLRNLDEKEVKGFLGTLNKICKLAADDDLTDFEKYLKVSSEEMAKP
jgi:DNA-binding MarR family transcriptional regulator